MQKKQIKHSLLKKTLFLIVGTMVLFVTASSFVSMVQKYSVSRKELAQKKEELAELHTKKNQTLALYESLETEEGRELYIREKYRVVKPGEELIVLSENENTVVDSSNKKSIWQKIKSFFTKKENLNK